jgi:hypothetical protein
MLEAEAILQQTQNKLIDAHTAHKNKRIAYLQAIGKS